jgi:hypothetical protein
MSHSQHQKAVELHNKAAHAHQAAAASHDKAIILPRTNSQSKPTSTPPKP